MTNDDYGPMGPGRGWDGRDGFMWDMHDGIGWAGWLLMALLALLLVALVVGLVLLLVRGTSTSRAPGATEAGARQGTAEEVLDERFARGEIDEEEYLRRRSVLRGGGA